MLLYLQKILYFNDGIMLQFMFDMIYKINDQIKMISYLNLIFDQQFHMHYYLILYTNDYFQITKNPAYNQSKNIKSLKV